MKHPLSFLILLFVCLVSSGQNSPVRFQHIDINDGLSLSSVYCVFRDSKGYMWFGTEDGLNRYDGYHFRVFRSEAENQNSICHKWIESIAEDSLGCLWFGSTNGLSRFNPAEEVFTNFTFANATNVIANDTIISLKSAGGIVLAGTASGLTVIDIHSLESTSFIETGWVYGIYLQDNEVVWICSKNGLYKTDLKASTIEPVITNEVVDLTFNEKEIWAVGTDQLWRKSSNSDQWEEINLIHQHELKFELVEMGGDNILWLGEEEGLYRFDTQSQVLKKIISASEKSKSLSIHTIKSLMKDEKGAIWYGTHGNGLYLINDEGVNLLTNNPLDPSSLSQNQINCIYQDPVNGNIWLGTYGAGLNIYNPGTSKFELMKHNPLQSNSLSSNFVWSICQARDGWIWVGTNDKGISCYHPKHNQFRYFDVEEGNPRALPNTSVRDVYEDHECTIWLGTDGGGLCRFDGEGFTVFTHREDDVNSLSDNSVRVIFEDSKDRFWVGTKNGLNLFNRETGEVIRLMHDPDNSNSLSNNFVYSTIMEDSEGLLWLGTYGGGLNCLDPESLHFTHYTTTSEIPISNDIVFSIYEDENRLLWIGTNQGLNCFDRSNKTMSFYGTNEGLPNEVIYGILPDDDGNLWLSTNFGICCFNMETKATTNFDINDGLQSNEFNGGAFYKGLDGKLYFGGVYGLNIIEPNKIDLSAKVNKTVFTRLDVMGAKVQTNPTLPKANLLKRDENDVLYLGSHISYIDEIRLPFSERFFSLEYSGMNHMFPTKTQYAFQLWPLDKEWNNAGNRNFVSYANVKPGKYIFKVKSSNSDGKWSDEVSELKINVLPPLWLKSWFIIIELLLVLAIVVFIYQYLLRQKTNKLLKKQNVIIKQANVRLRESENHLLSLNATKDKFFSIISHDLKNPFASLMSISDILHDNYNEYAEEDRKECVNKIHESIRQIHALLENLLTWSRSQRGKFDYELAEFNLSTVINENINLYRLAASKKNIQIEYIENGVEKAVADRNSINTVIRNLVGNAVKFTNDGGAIKIKSEKIEDKLKVSICDTGIGMSPDNCEKLFKIDQKLKREGTAGEKGTGLGLIICKEFVEKNGGNIGVESKEGKGSCFWFTLPDNK
ncbi:ligand-binding sensor domain-containing protein [Carboxylicivirga caseinilyticus]|uniref:ligand-binding sensor domain-containing protein n=1 Tax=Carboxylicivirga caseinilyticus TaxID=3417572 RepID=UPI003D34A9F3|nr:hypothetical protein [Marinilabiliaceae bacterium A049]